MAGSQQFNTSPVCCKGVDDRLLQRHRAPLRPRRRAGELAYHCYEGGLWARAMEWALRAAEKAAGLYAHGEALSHYTRARACAEQLGQPEQVTTIDLAIGTVYYTRGQFPQALESYTRALDATTEFYLGQWQDMHEYASREELIVQTLTRQLGVRFREEWIWILRACAAYYQGDLTTGVRLARESVMLATELHEHRAVIWANWMLVLLQTVRGAEEVADAVGEPAVRAADELIEVTIQCRCRIALAELCMQREEPSRAVELYEQCAALLVGTEIRVMQMELGAPMAEAYCAQGRLDEAT